MVPPYLFSREFPTPLALQKGSIGIYTCLWRSTMKVHDRRITASTALSLHRNSHEQRFKIEELCFKTSQVYGNSPPLMEVYTPGLLFHFI